MIFNSYAVLDAGVVALRLLLGVFVVAASARALLRPAETAADGLEAKTDQEDRFYLLFLTALVLLLLNVVSWPLFYLLLQSYVPEWPGVMCIYGVTQVGKGSQGASRFLPDLLTALQLLKPLVVFGSGTWMALYLINRRTQTAPLMRRTLVSLQVVGWLALVDAAIEGAYLLIPKKEDFLSSGCCTEAFDGAGRATRFLPVAMFGERYHVWLWVGYIASHVLMVGLAWAYLRGRREIPSRRGLALLFAGALLTIPMFGVFLIEIAAPELLRLPYHHCPYDLLPRAPESVLAIGLFVLAVFCVGWAFSLGWICRSTESSAILEPAVRRLLKLACFGYVGSLLMICLQLMLTWM